MAWTRRLDQPPRPSDPSLRRRPSLQDALPLRPPYRPLVYGPCPRPTHPSLHPSPENPPLTPNARLTKPRSPSAEPARPPRHRAPAVLPNAPSSSRPGAQARTSDLSPSPSDPSPPSPVQKRPLKKSEQPWLPCVARLALPARAPSLGPRAEANLARPPDTDCDYSPSLPLARYQTRTGLFPVYVDPPAQSSSSSLTAACSKLSLRSSPARPRRTADTRPATTVLADKALPTKENQPLCAVPAALGKTKKPPTGLGVGSRKAGREALRDVSQEFECRGSEPAGFREIVRPPFPLSSVLPSPQVDRQRTPGATTLTKTRRSVLGSPDASTRRRRRRAARQGAQHLRRPVAERRLLVVVDRLARAVVHAGPRHELGPPAHADGLHVAAAQGDGRPAVVHHRHGQAWTRPRRRARPRRPQRRPRSARIAWPAPARVSAGRPAPDSRTTGRRRSMMADDDPPHPISPPPQRRTSRPARSPSRTPPQTQTRKRPDVYPTSPASLRSPDLRSVPAESRANTSRFPKS